MEQFFAEVHMIQVGGQASQRYNSKFLKEANKQPKEQVCVSFTPKYGRHYLEVTHFIEVSLA
jgi:hypothetical protein